MQSIRHTWGDERRLKTIQRSKSCPSQQQACARTRTSRSDPPLVRTSSSRASRRIITAETATHSRRASMTILVAMRKLVTWAASPRQLASRNWCLFRSLVAPSYLRTFQSQLIKQHHFIKPIWFLLKLKGFPNSGNASGVEKANMASNPLYLHLYLVSAEFSSERIFLPNARWNS